MEPFQVAEDVDTVIINGNVINVTQKLALLKKSEEERDTAKAALDEQNSLLTQLKDTKGELDKKKKDLEKELEKTKKKLSDAVSSMKVCESLRIITTNLFRLLKTTTPI